MTIQKITEKMTTSPSYLKKGDAWLATRFSCSQKTIRRIKSSLYPVKKAYVSSL